MLQRADHFVLLRGGEPREGLVVRLAAIGFELGEAAAVEILLVLVGAGESEVEIVEHIGVARTGLTGRTRHQPFGERRDGGALVVIEENPVAVERLSRMRGPVRLRGGRLLRPGGSDGFCIGGLHQIGAGSSPGSDRADNKSTATFIMLAHVICSSADDG